MELNEIKKALYKQKPKATKSYTGHVNYYYTAELGDGTIIKFKIPIQEMGMTVFGDEMDAQHLIRWIDHDSKAS